MSHGVNSLTLVLVVKQLSTSETGFLKFWVVQTLNHLAAVYVDHPAFQKFLKLYSVFGSLILFIPVSNLIVTISTMRKKRGRKRRGGSSHSEQSQTLVTYHYHFAIISLLFHNLHPIHHLQYLALHANYRHLICLSLPLPSPYPLVYSSLAWLTLMIALSISGFFTCQAKSKINLYRSIPPSFVDWFFLSYVIRAVSRLYIRALISLSVGPSVSITIWSTFLREAKSKSAGSFFSCLLSSSFSLSFCPFLFSFFAASVPAAQVSRRSKTPPSEVIYKI